MDKKEIQSVWAAYLEVQEAKKKLDPVGKEDGDVDNDGDKDSSDEYLANRRKAVGKNMKKDDVKEGEESPYPSLDKKKREKKGSNLEDAGGPAAKLKGESVEVQEGEHEGEKEECPKCKGKGCDHCDGKGFHMKEYGMVKAGKKMKESVEEAKKSKKPAKMTFTDKKTGKKSDKIGDVIGKMKPGESKTFSISVDWASMMDESLFSEEELAGIEEKAKHVGVKGPDPAAPEEFMSTNSPNDKKVFADHEAGSDKKLEDYEETGEMDGAKAGKAVKSQSSARRGDNLKVGDNAMVTPSKAKGQ